MKSNDYREEISITDGGDMDNYDVVQAYKTFRHKDYCCPFCSHGETIKLKIHHHPRDTTAGQTYTTYLECSEECMKYGLTTYIGIRGYDEDQYRELRKKIENEAIKAFSKLIDKTKDMTHTDFIMV
jgi:hypothetical protein